jgi:hypothetical protein
LAIESDAVRELDESWITSQRIERGLKFERLHRIGMFFEGFVHELDRKRCRLDPTCGVLERAFPMIRRDIKGRHFLE